MRLIDESLWNAAIYAVEYLNDTSLLRKLIAEAEEPTIEAEPVRHGKWIKFHDELSKCSLCNYPVYTGWNQTKYCPECGAKMDGKEEK